MRHVATLADYAREPVGSFMAGRSWLHHTLRRDVRGFALWGHPEIDDVGRMLPAIDATILPALGTHVSIADVRRIDVVHLALFDLLVDMVRSRRDALGRSVERLALLHRGGYVGAISIGFSRVVDPPFPTEAFDDETAAAAWLGISLDDLRDIDGAIEAATRTPAILRDVAALLDAHVGRGMTLEAASQRLGLSRRNLQLRLKVEGTTFRREAQHAQVRRAKALLLEGNVSVTEVASEVGCASLPHFSVLFRKITGETPTRWRAVRRRAPG